MPIKVELHAQLLRFLRHDCYENERTAFHDAVDKVLREPIANSMPYTNPDIARHMLRVFEFAGNFAVCEFDAAYNDGQGRVRLIECRKPKRKRPLRPPRNGS